MMMQRQILRYVMVLAVIGLAPAPFAAAQGGRLTLADALKIAIDRSEAIDVAHAGESRADADEQRARSQKLPQVNLTAGYTRTLASEFSSAFDTSGPVCAPLSVNTGASLTDRVAELERAGTCGGFGSGFSLSNLPFGQRNAYQATFAFSQALFTSGRIAAQQTQADIAHRAALLVTSSTEAQVALDVTRAYYDAALSDRLVTIAESGYNQASAAFDQTKLAFDAGRQPEFELLRAQVARDNQRPTVIRRRADRDIAYLRLRQLLKLAADAPLVLDVDLDIADLAPPAPFAEALAAARAGAPADTRSSVQQAQTLVASREAGITIARAERLPSVNLTSSLGQVGYPKDGFVPAFGDFRTNWSIGAAVQVPVFNGWRLRGRRADGARRSRRSASAIETIPRAGAARFGHRRSGSRRGRVGLGGQRRHRAAGRARVSDRRAQKPRGAVHPARAVRLAAVAAGRAGESRAGRARRADRPRARGAAAQSAGRPAMTPAIRSFRSGDAMRRSIRPLFVIGLTALVASLAAAGCGGSTESAANAQPAPTVLQLSPENVITASIGTITAGPAISGQLTPAREATVRAQIGGSLVALPVDRGEPVKTGDAIARISSRDLDVSFDSSKVAVKAAQAALDVAKSEEQRTEALVKGGALAARDLEQAKNAVSAGEAQLASAQARQNSVGQQIDDTVVKAPFAGIVSARPASIGDVVSNGTEIDDDHRSLEHAPRGARGVRSDRAGPAEREGAVHDSRRAWRIRGHG